MFNEIATVPGVATPLIWDAHTCIPLVPNADLSILERHRRAGASFVSVNVGMDFNSLEQIIRVIAGFRASILERSDEFIMVRDMSDVRRAKTVGKMAIAFDLEGSEMLQEDLTMLQLFRDLGVGQIHLAYNRDNAIAGGCHGSGMGLTGLGRKVVKAVNRAGMIMDCSHSSKQASLDVMEISDKPVIFSHANPAGLKEHPRNVDDEQIRLCAQTGGVVGVSGIVEFLGVKGADVDVYCRHIDYIAQLVGPDHVGLGLDYVYDPTHDDLPAHFAEQDWWPENCYKLGKAPIIPPESFGAMIDCLKGLGYEDANIENILGGNFMRVAEETWGTNDDY